MIRAGMRVPAPLRALLTPFRSLLAGSARSPALVPDPGTGTEQTWDKLLQLAGREDRLLGQRETLVRVVGDAAQAREVAEAVRKIENAVGRDARDVEVAEVMGLSLNEYHKILQDSTGCRIFSFEDPGTLADEGYPQSNRQPNQPLENLQKSDFKQGLAQEIKGLPERERLVMALYYDEELNLREIGEILGVSESRVCQIHGQALIRLRARMGEWLAD